MDESNFDNDPTIVSTLDDGINIKMASATSKFLLGVANVYARTSTFLAADCASKFLTINNQLTSSRNLKTPTKKTEKFRRSLCPRCRTSLINGRLSWESRGESMRRYGDEKRLAKIDNRRQRGNRLSSDDRRILARFSKMDHHHGPRLWITCSTCQHVTGAPLAVDSKPTNRKKAPPSSSLIGQFKVTPPTSSLIGQFLQDDSGTSSEAKKKRKRRKTMPNAGLNLTGTKNENADDKEKEKIIEVETPKAAKLGNLHRQNQHSTPRWPQLVTTPVQSSGGSQNKKRLKSKLDKLLAVEAVKKVERISFGNSTGLSSFLESL